MASVAGLPTRDWTQTNTGPRWSSSLAGRKLGPELPARPHDSIDRQRDVHRRGTVDSADESATRPRPGADQTVSAAPGRNSDISTQDSARGMRAPVLICGGATLRPELGYNAATQLVVESGRGIATETQRTQSRSGNRPECSGSAGGRLRGGS